VERSPARPEPRLRPSRSWAAPPRPLVAPPR
jgi:hypothetical protein